MEKQESIFENENYRYISNFVEENIGVLKNNQDYQEKYKRLTDAMEELDITLTDIQKKQFHEIVQLFYQTEEYYFALSYSLGVKYGEDLKQI